MKKKRWTYDLECYPNFTCLSFKEIGKNNWKRFSIFFDKQDRKNSYSEYHALVEFLDKEVDTLVGYNSKSYDDTIISHLKAPIIKKAFTALHPEDICQNIRELSDEIISLPKGAEVSEYIQNLRRFKNYNSLDLFLLFNTIQRKGLKQISINLKHHRIQDLPLPPEHIVRFDEIEQIKNYNDNDVIITEKLLFKMQREIQEREDIFNATGIDVRNDNDTNIAKRILRQYYEQESGRKYNDYKDLRTRYSKLKLEECISPKIKFKTKAYQDLLEEIRKQVVDVTHRKDKNEDEDGFEFIVPSKYLTHTIAKGGIHSNNSSEIIEEDDQHLLLDYDVTSFYPYIMILLKLFPKHLGPDFLKGFEKIVTERVEAKAAGNDTKAGMLKISVNSAYGLTKSEHFWLYDPKVTLSVCVNGELFLLMLIEAIETRTKAQVIYSNTDGITVKCPKNEVQELREIIKAWENYTGFQMEENRYKRMILKDVNNYLIEAYKKDKQGNIKIDLKQKGDFLPGIKLATGYEYPIIPVALENYFIKGIPVEETIANHQDIYDFMRAQKSSAKFKMVHQAISFGMRIQDHKKLQKNNRWIVTLGNPEEGKLYKIELDDYGNVLQKSELEKGYLTTIVNDIDDFKPIDDYKLNHKFYIRQAKAIIDKVEQRKQKDCAAQLQLF